jgi:hypothetical protein
LPAASRVHHGAVVVTDRAAATIRGDLSGDLTYVSASGSDSTATGSLSATLSDDVLTATANASGGLA